MPDLTHEYANGAPDLRVCGVDEAGRGPLAGPVVAAAVALHVHAVPADIAAVVDDSKKLTKPKRERLFAVLCDPATTWADVAVWSVAPAEIDRINILQATMLAMQSAVERLSTPPDVALIDGNRAPKVTCRAVPLVGGDGLSLSIACASIVAKVTRDRTMAALAADHPPYGWERNAGYGTAEHLAALARHGATEHHRRSFRPVASVC